MAFCSEHDWSENECTSLAHRQMVDAEVMTTSCLQGYSVFWCSSCILNIYYSTYAWTCDISEANCVIHTKVMLCRCPVDWWCVFTRLCLHFSFDKLHKSHFSSVAFKTLRAENTAVMSLIRAVQQLYGIVFSFHASHCNACQNKCTLYFVNEAPAAWFKAVDLCLKHNMQIAVIHACFHYENLLSSYL